MPFAETRPEPHYEGALRRGRVAILGRSGLRLTDMNSFHLDEGPHFSWLNIYRALADGRQLDIPRERAVSSVTLEEGDVVVRWEPCESVNAALSARYRLLTDENAVDVTFSADAQAAYSRFELFIASYFTPYYTPRYAVSDNRIHPEGVFWYQKTWFGEENTDAWARDAEALNVFRDGRWLTGYPVNWRMGPAYALPLMTQEHKYGHAIVLMARREDAIGISGLHSYHNSQYFHLFGRDVEPGERLSATVRMVVLTEWDQLNRAAETLYADWAQEGN
ncbi:hypothetical protein FJZ36_18080 [Candidatus Poribacteria bacterium]|nr:hypothetical protein [Candidatus Poribacteria bacterium]